MRMYKREVKRRRAEKILRQAGVFFISLTPRLLLTLWTEVATYMNDIVFVVTDIYQKRKRKQKLMRKELLVGLFCCGPLLDRCMWIIWQMPHYICCGPLLDQLLTLLSYLTNLGGFHKLIFRLLISWMSFCQRYRKPVREKQSFCYKNS